MSSNAKKNKFNHLENFEALRKEILGSDLDEVTKQETMAGLDNKAEEADAQQGLSSQNKQVDLLGAVRKNLDAAKLGVDPKFKSRQATQMLFNMTVDQSDGNRLRGSMLNLGSSLRK